MGYLKPYWKKYKWWFVISVLCVTCDALCDLLQPRVMSSLIDNGAAKGDLTYVLHAGLLMLGIAGVGAVFAIARNITSTIASVSFGSDLRLDMFKRIQSLSVEDMDRFEGGSLVTRETSDVTQVQNFFNGTMRIFFKAPVICIGAIIMAATLDLKSLPIIFLIILLVAAVIFFSMKLAYPRFVKVQAALDGLNTTMREYLAGIRLVKAFRRFKEETARFSAANGALTDSTVKASQVLAVFSPFLSLFVNLGIAAILLAGARWVNAGDMQVGQVMAFVTYMTQILVSLNMISNLLNMFVRVRASNERIAEVLATPAERETTAAGGGRAHPAAAHIAFEQVDFTYRGATGQPALAGLNFALRQGQTLGVIGSTGSGKSTVAALLMRFYAPTGGAIWVNGENLAALPAAGWRQRVALVPQAPMLFGGTVRENILWGRQSASEAEVEAAARAAQAWEFISASPKGLDTVVGQSGVNLSGGQKQRLSIARALVRMPELLVLDDCTSALDMMTEARVRQALREYPMTSVLITQRISTAMGCDVVLVLENGRQAGFGTHDELMETCAEYRDIYRSQIGGDEVG